MNEKELTKILEEIVVYDEDIDFKYIDSEAFFDNIDKVPDPIPKEWGNLLAMNIVYQDYLELVGAMIDLSYWTDDFSDDELSIPRDAVAQKLTDATDTVITYYSSYIENQGIWRFIHTSIEDIWLRIAGENIGSLKDMIKSQLNPAQQKIYKWLTEE